ncbi:MAG: dihydroorotase [Gammaproteobacteria bacterium]|nr:dihydroorotase [Gammaproteobacteria bacterium]MDH5240206.1 dihydroorotase [Gammaproteobacteria bacterium]MDH5262439.1 dihydroorotase [Gammaproteobacteria bacterium]MDH5582564.1 dihydroorotase [Gammaproteobacteria bacterium]
MSKLLISNASLINEGEIRNVDVLVDGERIAKVASSIAVPPGATVLDLAGAYLMPGMIDDQVHFREPGLTHKGDLATESAAAVAGGITSFMDMPNVNPQTTTRAALRDKYEIAQHRCSANFGFYLGATNSNIEEIKALKVGEAAGIKAFLGASTGDMLVDNPQALDKLFEHAPVIVLTHCEDSPMIWDNEAVARKKFGDDVPFSEHPAIRSAEACLKSSTMASGLARKHDALLHILHLTTAVEMDLFSPAHRSQKRITAEVCVHHLWFDESRYAELGAKIKCNPAIKRREDREALIAALNDQRIDVIATDHAPHTAAEKANSYFKSPAGLPLVQHAVLTLFDLALDGQFGLELIVDRACHAPADLFGIAERGYVREGYFADLVVVDPAKRYRVDASNLLSKCQWSPFEGHEFRTSIDTTIVNGQIAYQGGALTGVVAGQKLKFGRAR